MIEGFFRDYSTGNINSAGQASYVKQLMRAFIKNTFGV